MIGLKIVPRAARNLFDGGYFHIINRGNNRLTVFHSPLDYQVFMGLMKEAKCRFPLSLLAYCLMPNHFHLLIQAIKSASVGRCLHWLTTCYSGYYRTRYGTSGHIWQGRFRSFTIECEDYLITAARYIESNPLRATLVRSNREWGWSSLGSHLSGTYGGLIDPPPFYLASGWLEMVDTPLTEKEYEVVRRSKGDSPSTDACWDSQNKRDSPLRGQSR